MEYELCDVDVHTVSETEMAVRFDDGDKQFWVPKSVMEDWPYIGEDGVAMICVWFAEKEELI